MATLGLDTVIQRNPDMISADMDGETVMMSIEQGEYFGLSGIGPFIWDNLETAIAISALCEKVMEVYDVDEATCQRDIIELVDALQGRNIVNLVPQG